MRLRGVAILACYSVCYLAVTTLTSLALVKIEQPFEQSWRERFRLLKADFEANGCSADTTLDDVIAHIEEGQNHGFSVRTDDSSSHGWTNAGSFLFMVSLGTTVGFGHLAPGTVAGKVLVIILILLLVPMTLILTSAVAGGVLRASRKLRRCMSLRLFGERTSVKSGLLHLLLMTVVLGTLLVGAGLGLVLGSERDWSVLDGLYFLVVSVSTVGLGDMPLGGHLHGAWRDAYCILIAVLLLVGVTVVLVLLETYLDIPQVGFHTLVTHWAAPEEEDPEDDPEDTHLIEDAPAGYGTKSPQDQ